MVALFVAKQVGGDYPHIGFRQGTTQYTSRRTGKRYIVEPSPEGLLVSSDGLLVYTDSDDRAVAMRFIELSDASVQ
jgi:hypothetical protein